MFVGMGQKHEKRAEIRTEGVRIRDLIVTAATITPSIQYNLLRKTGCFKKNFKLNGVQTIARF
jgi:hypothetical protein